VKWVQLGYVRPAEKLGEGPASRNYFGRGDVLRIAFFKLLTDSGWRREQAAKYLRQEDEHFVDKMILAGRSFFNCTRLVPVHSAFGAGSKVFGFSTKRHQQSGPFSFTIDLNALAEEIKTLTERMTHGE
jgi:hypothetical protein